MRSRALYPWSHAKCWRRYGGRLPETDGYGYYICQGLLETTDPVTDLTMAIRSTWKRIRRGVTSALAVRR